MDEPFTVYELLLVPKGNFIVATPSSFYDTLNTLLSVFLFDSVKF